MPKNILFFPARLAMPRAAIECHIERGIALLDLLDDPTDDLEPDEDGEEDVQEDSATPEWWTLRVKKIRR